VRSSCCANGSPLGRPPPLRDTPRPSRPRPATNSKACRVRPDGRVVAACPLDVVDVPSPSDTHLAPPFDSSSPARPLAFSRSAATSDPCLAAAPQSGPSAKLVLSIFRLEPASHVVLLLLPLVSTSSSSSSSSPRSEARSSRPRHVDQSEPARRHGRPSPGAPRRPRVLALLPGPLHIVRSGC
jgi:hypothetical protein